MEFRGQLLLKKKKMYFFLWIGFSCLNAVYCLLLITSPQGVLILTCSTSECWKVELTLEPRVVLNPRPLYWSPATWPLGHSYIIQIKQKHSHFIVRVGNEKWCGLQKISKNLLRSWLVILETFETVCVKRLIFCYSQMDSPFTYSN